MDVKFVILFQYVAGYINSNFNCYSNDQIKSPTNTVQLVIFMALIIRGSIQKRCQPYKFLTSVHKNFLKHENYEIKTVSLLSLSLFYLVLH